MESISVSDDTVIDTVRKNDTLKGDTLRGVDTLNDTLIDTVTPLVTPNGTLPLVEKLIMFGERLKKLEEIVQEQDKVYSKG